MIDSTEQQRTGSGARAAAQGWRAHERCGSSRSPSRSGRHRLRLGVPFSRLWNPRSTRSGTAARAVRPSLSRPLPPSSSASCHAAYHCTAAVIGNASPASVFSPVLAPRGDLRRQQLPRPSEYASRHHSRSVRGEVRQHHPVHCFQSGPWGLCSPRLQAAHRTRRSAPRLCRLGFVSAALSCTSTTAAAATSADAAVQSRSFDHRKTRSGVPRRLPPVLSLPPRDKCQLNPVGVVCERWCVVLHCREPSARW